jgi:hypothetical protein
MTEFISNLATQFSLDLATLAVAKKQSNSSHLTPDRQHVWTRSNIIIEWEVSLHSGRKKTVSQAPLLTIDECCFFYSNVVIFMHNKLCLYST